MEHVKEKYEIQIAIQKDEQKKRAKIIQDENDALMRKKKDGDTLGEKIENVLEKLKKKRVTNCIDDAFYQLKFENGIPFYVRGTNLLRDHPTYKKDAQGEQVKLNLNRTLNVVDEQLETEKALKTKQQAAAYADKTFDQFMDRYGCHFDGQIDPAIRIGDRPETVPFNPNSKRK